MTGVPSPEAAEVIGEKIKALADDGQVISFETRLSGKLPVEYTLRLVRDPRAFAGQITFGTVTNRSGREITVAAFPVSAEDLRAQRATEVKRNTFKAFDSEPANASKPVDPSLLPMPMP